MKSSSTLYMLFIATIFWFGCEEQVDTPSPDFYIEITDPVEGIVKLQEPYQVNVGQTFYILAENNADFNSFWPGDVVYSEDDTIIQVFDQNLTIKHRGLKLGEEGVTSYSYTKTGSYTYTFVSVNVNAGASIMEVATKSGTITVQE